MPAYLLTWNPERFEWSDLNRRAVEVARGKSKSSGWSCGNTTSIPFGARFFLYRQGRQGRGIVGAGWVTRPTYKDPHWDPTRRTKGELANYVGIELQALLDPDKTLPLPVEQIATGPIASVNWHTPASGIRIPAPAVPELEELWALHTGSTSIQAGILDDAVAGLEGRARLAMVLHRSRDRALRNSKIQAARAGSPDGRLRCEVPGCRFDFLERYGPLGRDYAEVHHLTPLSAYSDARVSTLADLVIVCSNCHAMIHRGGASRDIADLIQPGSAA